MRNQGKIINSSELFKDLENGCDISCPLQAMAIRWLEFQHPEMIDVVGPMGDYDVRDRLPYLGAILKPQGRRSKGTVTDCLRAFLTNPGYNRSSWKKAQSITEDKS